jgi:hypothetical protein
LFLLPPVLAACGSAPDPRPQPEQIREPHADPLRGTAAVPLRDLLEGIELERRRLVFRPTRDDMTIARAVFTVHCSRPDEVRLNGARPESSWTYMDLVPVGENEFELAPLKIEVSLDGVGLLCMSVKVWFREVPNEFDSLYYENPDDRYALVSFCTSAEGPDWQGARPRFKQNRVATLEQFREALSKPFDIRMNRRPLEDLDRLRQKVESGK